MRQTRLNMFETNSSSVHSLVIRNRNNLGKLKFKQICVDGRIYVAAEFGEYHWGYECLRTPQEKLSYALTMVVATECGDHDLEDEDRYAELPSTDGFMKLNDFIRFYDFAGIYLPSWEEIRNEGAPIGSIDHQSYEDYFCLQDFLDDYEIDLNNFLLNPDVHVIIDNDNR